MTEAITIPMQKMLETTSLTAREGVSQIGASEVCRPGGATEGGKLTIGGDVRSVLAVLEVDPTVLGTEVQSISPTTEAVDVVPLKNSKGEVQHNVSSLEAKHYADIGLRAQEVNGRECLVRDDIDWEKTDNYGQINRERAQQGLAPLDPNGRPYELHHIQMQSNGMLAELTYEEHRGPETNRMLHDPTKTSEINRAEFDQTRINHWRARAAEV